MSSCKQPKVLNDNFKYETKYYVYRDIIERHYLEEIRLYYSKTIRLFALDFYELIVDLTFRPHQLSPHGNLEPLIELFKLGFPLFFTKTIIETTEKKSTLSSSD